MSEYTKEDAAIFIESLRLTVANRVGFKWLTGKLEELTAYLDSITEENERLNAYIDSVHARDDYESQRASRQVPGGHDTTSGTRG